MKTQKEIDNKKLTSEEVYGNSIIRTITVLFGSIFSNFHVRKYDKKGNIVENESTLIPITYSAKQGYMYWLQQLLRQPMGNTEVAKKFPRLSYELNGFSLDTDRIMNTNVPIYGKTVSRCGRTYSSASPIAYVFDFTLSLWTKDMDTSLQIIDQIIPIFAPQIAIKFTEDKKLNLVNDVIVELQGVQKNDTWMNEYETQRIIEWDFSFLVHADFLPSIGTSAIIKKVISDVVDTTYTFATTGLNKIKYEVETEEKSYPKDIVTIRKQKQKPIKLGDM